MKTILITENQLKMLIKNILIDYKNNNININNEQQYNPKLEKFKKESNMKIWFLENVVDQVKQIPNPRYPDYIDYINKDTGEAYMRYNKKSKNLWVNYDKIWKYFESKYTDNYMEISRLMAYLMLEHYNLMNVTSRTHIIYKNLN